MRRTYKIILISFCLFLLFCGLSYLFLLLNAKNIFLRALDRLTPGKVSVEYCSVSPDFRIQLKEIKLGEGKIGELNCRLDPFALFSGVLALEKVELISPVLGLIKEQDRFLFTADPSAGAEVREEKEENAARLSSGGIKLIAREVSIRDGIVNFVDDTIEGGPLALQLRDFKLDIRNAASFKTGERSDFDFSAIIPWEGQEKEGTIFGSGWVDAFNRDIEAELSVKGIDALFFYHYYAKWLSLDKANIQSANLNFYSRITGIDNIVSAKCRLELSDVIFKPHKQGYEEELREKITNAVLDLFRGENEQIVLDFTVNTSFEKPIFGFAGIKSVVENRIEKSGIWQKFQPGLLSVPNSFFQGLFRGVNDLSRAAVSSAVGIGRVVNDTVNAAFNQEKEE